MSILAVSQNISYKGASPLTGTNVTYPNPQQAKSGNEPKASNKVRIGVLLTTAAGVAIAMARTFKKKELPMNNIKDFFHNLAHIKYDNEKNEVEWLVGRLAIGSVGGGLAGGLLLDKKENRKAKYREAIIQLVGNILTPLACVDLGMKGFNKFIDPKLQKALKLSEKTRSIPGMAASAGLLGVAIILGNKVGNYLNAKLFRVNDKRKLKLTDMSPHIDDACLALSLVPSENSSTIGTYLKRIIPAALMIAGYSTGTAQKRPNIIEHDNKKQ